MSYPVKDMTGAIDLSAPHAVGPVRLQRPEHTQFLPPCNNACPSGENIQRWLSLAQAGDYYGAWKIIVEDNPFPAISGRICYHPCQSSCNRQHVDSAVNIHAIERFIGDMAIEENWPFDTAKPRSGKRVLVVGAGPSGLSAAYHLARQGHSVVVKEAGPIAGGMLHFGIPAYRLPRDVLAMEVQRLENLGVEIHCNQPVENVVQEKKDGHFDAVFLAIGAHIDKRIDIPARDAGKIYDAVKVLKSVETGTTPNLGRRVAIYGGGNTAMDVARTAKRLGVDEAMIIYRRDRAHMPAHAFEADEALSEQVKIHWLRTIRQLDEQGLTVERMELDEDGQLHATGELETLAADSVILALGQNVDTEFLARIPGLQMTDDGQCVVDSAMMTSISGLFAGGDMVPSQRTATVAIGHGKKAARNIHAWLHGETVPAQAKAPIVGYEQLHLWFESDAPFTQQREISTDKRDKNFEEIVGGLTEMEASYEARRCFSCGNCFECDGCFGACPQHAISKLGHGRGYSINYDMCTGCSICVEQCPCHAMTLIPEPRSANKTPITG